MLFLFGSAQIGRRGCQHREDQDWRYAHRRPPLGNILRRARGDYIGVEGDLSTGASQWPVWERWVGGDLFGGAGGYDLAAAAAAFGAHVDDPVGGFDDVEIVLDDEQRAAAVDELAEGGEELGDVVEVEAGGGLVEDVEGAAAGFGCRFVGGAAGDGARGGEVRGELDALGFAAGERGGGLAEADVAEADLVEDVRACRRSWDGRRRSAGLP